MRLDHHIEGHTSWLFDGGPESARELLSTIASSMLTFTALVFSITILALQLASNQFSPRVIRTFLQQVETKLAMATFVGTFVYAVAVLAAVRSPPAQFVPAIATWIALVLVLASIGVFIHYVHRMTHSVRAITVITKVSSETRDEIERLLAADPASSVALPRRPTGHDDAPDTVAIHRGPPGVVTYVDTDRLVQLAADADARFELVPRIGGFVVTGADLLRIRGSRCDVERCCAAIAFDVERTPHQDPAFGFRQLVDIALRAVSPGINDPSTAVQAIDHLHDLLRRLTVRDLPPGIFSDDDGIVRLIVPAITYPELVRLAFQELREYAASSSQVMNRIEQALIDCAAVAPADKRGAIEDELRVLRDRR